MVPDVTSAVYQTQISLRPVAAGNSALVSENGWVTGLTFTLSTDLSDGNFSTTIQLGSIYLLGGPDGVAYASLSDGRENNLIIDFAFDAGTEQIICAVANDMYLKAQIVFDPSGERFSGTVLSMCNDEQPNTCYGWKGNYTGIAKSKEWIASFSKLCATAMEKSKVGHVAL